MTNAAAQRLNLASVALRRQGVTNRLEANKVPSDPVASGGEILLASGLRVRPTQNVDKERGFVNGAMGVIEKVLGPSYFVFRSATTDVRILMYPMRLDSIGFLPATCFDDPEVAGDDARRRRVALRSAASQSRLRLSAQAVSGDARVGGLATPPKKTEAQTDLGSARGRGEVASHALHRFGPFEV